MNWVHFLEVSIACLQMSISIFLLKLYTQHAILYASITEYTIELNKRYTICKLAGPFYLMSPIQS